MDVLGTIMEAHDGNLVRWTDEQGGDGRFYWYGMSYGLCQEQPSGCSNTTPGACGFSWGHRLLVYASPDLSSGSWEFLSDALPEATRPGGIYYRPKVFRHAASGTFILWINYLFKGDFGNSQYLVATSKTPTGPFEVITDSAKTLYRTGGDFDVLVDDDGAAYIAYTSLAEDHKISVERLTDDYMGSMAASDPKWSSGFVGGSGNEAPTMFKRGSWYYLLFGSCCCFCGEGSGAEVWAAKSPLGPYTSLGEIGRKKKGESITGAQQNYVFRAGDKLVWTGDRWQSAPDRIKDHDFQYWTQLKFDDSRSPPKIDTLKWEDQWTLEF